MSVVQLECLIDGQNVSTTQLEKVQYDLHLHMLREMKKLGATLRHDGKSLSDDDIGRLTLEEARDVSIATRKSLGVEGLKELFRDELLATDQMWKDANDVPEGAPSLYAQTDVKVTGVTLEEVGKVINLNAIHEVYAQMHPDHCFAKGDGKLLEHMEVFGHFGGPTWLYAHPSETISVPVERDEAYPMVMAGSTTLASDGTPMNLFAYHQFKPLDDGFAIKQCAIFPPGTPQDIVEGHKLHLAIEIWEGAKLAAAQR